MHRRLYITVLASVLAMILAGGDMPANIMNKMFKSDASAKELFKAFHLLYEKNYELNSEEALTRFRTFRQNLKKLSTGEVAGFSAAFDEESSYEEHVEHKRAGYDLSKIQIPEQTVSFPHLNWTAHHCWVNPPYTKTANSISAPLGMATLLQFSHCLTSGFNIPLSLQQLIDCNTAGGWWMSGSQFEYYAVSTGIYSNASYPFVNQANQTCKDKSTSGTPYKVKRWEQSPQWFSTAQLYIDTATIYQALSRGPIMFGINFGPSTNSNGVAYTGGMYVPSSFPPAAYCSYYYFVALVGFGTTPQGQDFWIIQSLFGSAWGETGGTFRIARNETANNWGLNCGYNRPSF